MIPDQASRMSVETRPSAIPAHHTRAQWIGIYPPRPARLGRRLGRRKPQPFPRSRDIVVLPRADRHDTTLPPIDAGGLDAVAPVGPT